MSAAVDANVLLYASDEASDRYPAAQQLLRRLAAGPELLYLFWPVVTAYLRIATHPSVFAQPLRPEQARDNVAALLARPHLRAPGEGESFWPVLRDTCAEIVCRGNVVPDAHIAALMRHHGVVTIYSSDRDFRRFDGLRVHDPFA